MPTQPIRLAVFSSHPIQYQAPLFRELARRRALELTVFFGSRHGLDRGFDPGFGKLIQWDIPLLDGYRSVFLENRAERQDVSTFFGVNVPSIFSAWSGDRFDAVLVLGWNTLGHVQAICAAKLSRTALLLRGESTLEMRSARRSAHRLASIIGPIRNLVYRGMFRAADVIFPIGTRNTAYYRAHGVSPLKLIPVPYCVENTRFELSLPVRMSERNRIRSHLGFPERAVVFTSAAKVIHRKRPFALLQAFAKLRGRRPDLSVALLYLGDGPERKQLEGEIASAGLGDVVRISGFVNQSEIPSWYAASDCLVLPSDGLETWGLVVNEGMAAGLPVIVSDVAGCTPDLILDGVNGFSFDWRSPEALSEKMEAIAEMSNERRRNLGQRSREIVGACSFSRLADAVEVAARRWEPLPDSKQMRKLFN